MELALNSALTNPTANAADLPVSQDSVLTLCLVGWWQAPKLQPRRSQLTRPTRLLKLCWSLLWKGFVTWESGHRGWIAIVKLCGCIKYLKSILQLSVGIGRSEVTMSTAEGCKSAPVVVPGLECELVSRVEESTCIYGNLHFLFNERITHRHTTDSYACDLAVTFTRCW